MTLVLDLLQQTVVFPVIAYAVHQIISVSPLTVEMLRPRQFWRGRFLFALEFPPGF